MCYWQVLTLVVLSGLGGGFISAVASLLQLGKTDKGYEAAKGMSLPVFVWGRGVLGIGGAFAVMLAIISASRYKDEATASNLLFLTSVCLVAGFVGERLLTAVARRVEDQIAAVDKKVDEKTEETQQYVKVQSNILAALQSLSTRNYEPTTISQHIKDLESGRQQPQFRLDRTLNIVLARLYADGRQDYDKAIAVLKEFIQEKTKQAPADVNVADAYFNIACYLVRKIKATPSGDTADLRKQALEALAQSVRITPQNAQDAPHDEDLEFFLGDPDFKKIAGPVTDATSGPQKPSDSKPATSA
jgi:tetratricopeptide (TPR) repeat protein